MAALRSVVLLARQAGARVLLVKHWDREELTSGPRPGHYTIVKAAAELGVPVIDLRNRLTESLHNGREVYRDNIHLTAAGQRALAERLRLEIRAALRSSDPLD